MGIEGITGGIASYQNSNVAPEPQVKPVANMTESMTGSDAGNTIAQEVLTVQNNANAQDNSGKGGEEQKQPSKETMEKRLSDINKQLNNTECVWGVDDATDRITIKIVDKETKDVIKELPPEKTLEMIAKAWELAGILVDEKL